MGAPCDATAHRGGLGLACRRVMGDALVCLMSGVIGSWPGSGTADEDGGEDADEGAASTWTGS